MAIGFKPVLSKLLFLGIVLLAVQLKNTAVDAVKASGETSAGGAEVEGDGSTAGASGGAQSSGPSTVACEADLETACTTLACGSTKCSQQGTGGKATGTPFCKCTMDIAPQNATDNGCKKVTEARKEPTSPTDNSPATCAFKCNEVTVKSQASTKMTYTAMYCDKVGEKDTKICTCIPDAKDQSALEQNPDDMENVAMGMMKSFFKFLSDYITNIVQSVFGIMKSMEDMDLPGMMTDMMDGMKDVMAAMKDGDKDEGKGSEK